MKNSINTEFMSLKGHFLIAMPDLADPFFGRAVICVCEHTKEGALGVVINQRHPLIETNQILDEFNLKTENTINTTLCIGGPVQLDELFVLHGMPFDWQGTLAVTSEVYLTNTFDILEGIANGEGPDKYLLMLGCSAWGPGQLETELMGNTWLTTPLSTNVIFNVPVGNKWNEAVKSSGIDPALLSSTAGHA